MNVLNYESLNEKLYFEQLVNGLKVYVLPKAGFQKTYATFSTHYGSVDNHFQAEGQAEMKVPDGIAHFLEHKMFEEPTGDVFATFASQGASANAFTSFDRTAYLFSATEHIQENVITLLNFVQNPYFTDENVEKEKGIIAQEITMYQDNPDWRSYFGLIEAMYQKHPIHIDIAGTIESISHISKETLYDCYHTFYHPNNMILFVVGGVDAEEIISLVRENQAAKNFTTQGDIQRFFQQEPTHVNMPKKTIQLPVSQPKCLFGFKETPPNVDGIALLRQELTTKVMMDALFSPSSTIYQTLYDENLISDNFGHEYNCSKDYAFSIIGGDTSDPELLMSRLKQMIEEVIVSGVASEDFNRSRKKKIGGYLRMLNSPEAIANEFTKYYFNGGDLFAMLEIYEAMTEQHINERLREHFQWQQMAASIVSSDAL
ncbi:MAG: zinc protease [Bacilli bacterium]|nr:zinc protease [Bacilli bacterium]